MQTILIYVYPQLRVRAPIVQDNSGAQFGTNEVGAHPGVSPAELLESKI